MLFWNGRVEASLERFQLALQKMDRTHIGARNEIEIYIATASQMLGQGQPVVSKYQQELYNEAKDGTRKARLIGSLIFIHLLSGELAKALKWAKTILDLGIRTSNAFITAWGEYLLAYIHYQRNDLKAAVQHFSRALEDRFFLTLNAPIDSFAGLALACQVMKHPGKASETVERMLEFARQSKRAELMDLAGTARIELLLAQGDPGSEAHRLKDTNMSTCVKPLNDSKVSFTWPRQLTTSRR